MDSQIPGLYDMALSERIAAVTERCDLSPESKSYLQDQPVEDVVDRLSENVIGSISLPLSVATNFVIDGTDRLNSMATEESSVVAAASGLKLAKTDRDVLTIELVVREYPVDLHKILGRCEQVCHDLHEVSPFRTGRASVVSIATGAVPMHVGRLVASASKRCIAS